MRTYHLANQPVPSALYTRALRSIAHGPIGRRMHFDATSHRRRFLLLLASPPPNRFVARRYGADLNCSTDLLGVPFTANFNFEPCDPRDPHIHVGFTGADFPFWGFDIGEGRSGSVGIPGLSFGARFLFLPFCRCTRCSMHRLVIRCSLSLSSAFLKTL